MSENLNDLFEHFCEKPEIVPAEVDRDTEQEEEKPRFKVTDIRSAEWAVKKIALYEQKKAEAQNYVKEEIEKLEAWLAGLEKEYDGNIQFFTETLRPYAMQQIEGTKKKSVKLPSGTLQFSKSTQFNRDETKLLNFLKGSFPEFVKVKESADWSGFKEKLKFTEDGFAITEDGEKLDFIKKVETENFKVKV